MVITYFGCQLMSRLLRVEGVFISKGKCIRLYHTRYSRSRRGRTVAQSVQNGCRLLENSILQENKADNSTQSSHINQVVFLPCIIHSPLHYRAASDFESQLGAEAKSGRIYSTYQATRHPVDLPIFLFVNNLQVWRYASTRTIYVIMYISE